MQDNDIINEKNFKNYRNLFITKNAEYIIDSKNEHALDFKGKVSKKYRDIYNQK